METRQFTLQDLKRILLEGAGADEGVDLDGQILDVSFEHLGYESLALLETGGRIEREYSVTLDDSSLSNAATPRTLIQTVNAQLATTAGAA